ncbi:MAG: 50S ribosomal protein L2 [Victivallales bacterium]|nr:50S ribosomal protein L2 [Victivallales bacterium]
MALKKYKPYAPGRRQMTDLANEEITANTPEKKLLKGKKNTGGRNNGGRITTRFRGGGCKRKYRVIDFKRDKFDIPGTVKTIEYDPNRNANIALVAYADGEKRYILAPVKLKIGSKVLCGQEAEVKPGNAKKLKNIPVGINIHNIEVNPGCGAKLVRSAGQTAVVRAKEGKYVQVKLPSGEIRMINRECLATIGQIGNIEKQNINLGKAGKKRYLGKRPHVRGVVMNPVDHPMGGGEGKSSGGGQPQSPWGQLSKGKKTRKKKKNTNKLILVRRKK